MTEWWEEDPELLGATLGLLAAWDGDASDVKTDASFSPPSPASDEASTTTCTSASSSGGRAKRSVNVSRERRKQELQFLRKKVADLETQLTDLRDRRESQLRPHFRDERRTQLATVAPVWENMTTRQIQARKRSELLNAKLKTTLAAQLRVAHDLIRAIQHAEQRSRAAGPATIPSGKVPIDVSQFMSEEEQLARLDMLVSNWESEIALCAKIAAESRDPLQFLNCRVLDDSEEATVIEIVSSSVLPYEVSRVGAAMWGFFVEDIAEDENGEYHAQTTATDDLIISVFSAAATLDSGAAGTYNGKFVMKRLHPTASQCVHVSHTQSEPEGFANELEGVTTSEDTWVRLIDAKELGHTQFSGPLTVLQHVRRERIILKQTVNVDNPRSRMETVTQIIMKNIHEEIEWAQEMLENVLLSDSNRIKQEPQ